MANQWLFTENEPQDSAAKEAHEELFVFGYACKVFRDDEKARNVDKGLLLIPWMGDDRLKIDRYDGRGHLYDLSAYDADKAKMDTELTEEEKQIEALCDEERYLELHTDIAEKNMYEEEEWKRYYESLAEGYKAVGFSYDYNLHGAAGAGDQLDPEDKPFVPPAEMKIPEGMVLPDTIKANAIIEKTAKFISKQGAQMEIMMKTKQSRNPQFEFMHFEHELYPYYKHLIKMIKSGIYKPKEKEEEEEERHDESMEDNQYGYLHPTLMNRSSPTPEVFKPVPMPKVHINETSYGQLLQSLTRSNQEAAEKSRPKMVKQEVKIEPDDAEPPAHAQSDPQPEDGPTQTGMPPPPGIEPVTLPSHPQGTDHDPGGSKADDEDSMSWNLHLSEQLKDVVPPPPDVQPVVDRMAMYVAKNGVEFETVVKSKKDARFEFLHSHHKHFNYYDIKKHLFIQEMDREKRELEREKEEKAALAASKAVKFKVKAKDQEQITLEKKKVFEYESSDEEHTAESENNRDKDVSGTSTPLNDIDQTSENKVEHITEIPPEILEKKKAEQRVKDRLVASAREKLSQVDKEKNLMLERKRKAAMFINMLKGANPAEGQEEESNTSQATIVVSEASLQKEDETSKRSSEDRESSKRHSKSKSKSKHKSRKRRSRSRSQSRSRSRSRSKRSNRSATPPNAYAVVRRSPLRRPPPPPPLPRHYSPVRRSDRSPDDRHKLKSKTKRKKRSKSRSRSPHTESSSHHRSSKKKKKKARLSSRSPSKKHRRDHSPSPVIVPDLPISPTAEDESRVTCPVPPEDTGDTNNSACKSGDSESRLEDGEILSQESISRSSSVKPQEDHDSDSVSGGESPQPSDDGSSVHESESRHASQSPDHHGDRDNSKEASSSLSAVHSPDISVGGRDENRLQPEAELPVKDPSTNVSQYMLSRVRAIIKASHEVILKEDGPFDDP